MRKIVTILIFLISFLFTQTDIPKKELIVFEDDFSQNRWTVWSLSGADSINSFALTGVKSRSANTAIAIFASHPGAQDEWIISPKLDFSNSSNTPLLTFNEDHDFWYQSLATHEVLYALVENPTPEDFQSLITWKKEDHSIYGFYGQSVDLTLEGLAGEQTVHIAFRYNSQPDQYDDNWYLDDVKITQNVLYDGTIFKSSLADWSKLSSATPTPLTVNPQNRGFEPATFPVIAKLFDHQGKLYWSDSSQTSELEYLGKDTLSFSIPTVTDSAWYNLVIITDLENDQARNNDTLSVELNTYQSPRRSIAEAFLNTQNYFSEGPALIVDSLAKLEDISVYPVWHFYTENDTLLTNASAQLAAGLNVNNSSTIILDREVRYNEAYTFVQDWAKRVTTVKTGVLARNSLKTPLTISGNAAPGPGDGTVNIYVEVTQKALLPNLDFNLEIWLIEKKRDFTWLRIDTLLHRGVDVALRDNFNSASMRDVIYANTINYNYPESGSLTIADVENTYFLVIVGDKYGTVLNATHLEIGQPITGLKEDDRIIDDFHISGNFPNPFNPSTEIRFSLPIAGNVDFRIYSVTGRLIHRSNNFYQAGNNGWQWIPDGVSSGSYFVVVQYLNMVKSHKVLLIK